MGKTSNMELVGTPRFLGVGIFQARRKESEPARWVPIVFFRQKVMNRENNFKRETKREKVGFLCSLPEFMNFKLFVAGPL